MAISDFARPGDKIDITYLHQNNGKVYKSSVFDFLGDAVLEIGMPTESGKMVLFQVGFECSMFFYTQKGMFTCEGKVLDRYKKDGFYMMSVKIISAPKKYQRRDFYRVETAIDFNYYKIAKEITLLESTADLFEEITDPKYIPEKPKNYLIYKIFIFISILVSIASVVVNLLFLEYFDNKYWFAIVLGGLFFLWILVAVTIISKNNIILKLILQGITIGIVLYTIEINTSLRDWWSVIYVIPSIITLIEVATSVLMICIPKKAQSFMLYLLILSIIGIVPFIVVLLKELRPLWLSLVCMIVSAVILFGIFFFGTKELKDELNKKMHI